MGKPLKATDRRRQYAGKRRKSGVRGTEDQGSGAGRPLADLFNDRRNHNGSGTRAEKRH